MRPEDFEEQVARTWASHFGCPPEDLDRPGTALVALERLAGSGSIHLAHIRQRTFAEIDPGFESGLRSLLSQAGRAARLTAPGLRRTAFAHRLLTEDHGLIFHLNPDGLVEREPVRPIVLRGITRSDQTAQQALFARCAPGEVDDAYVDGGHEIACGCFDGERMVACGSGYRRHGFMDLGVLTDPAYRGRRLAPAVVAGLSRLSLERGAMVMYRCDEANSSSRRVAQAAGFTRCFHTESLKLEPV